MSGLLWAACSAGLLLVVGLVSSIIWLSKSRKAQVKAEIQVKALTEGMEKRNEADAIMAEPVADESAWLIAAAERLRDSDGS